MKKKKTGHRKLVFLLALIVLLAVTFFVVLENFAYTVSQIDRDVRITIDSEIKRYADTEQALDKYNEFVQDAGRFALEYSANYLKEYGVTPDNLNDLCSMVMLNLYYTHIDEDGDSINTVTSTGSNSLGLTGDEIRTLAKESYLEKNNDKDILYYYRAKKLGDVYVIVKYQAVSFESIGYNMDKPRSTRADELLFWIDSEENILSCSDDEYVGKNIGDISSSDVTGERFTITSIDGRGYGITEIGSDGDRTVVAFLELAGIAAQIMRSALVPVILIWVVFITILVFVLRIKKEQLAAGIAGEKKKAVDLKVIIFDRYITSHIAALALFGVILIGLTLFYVSALINYSDQNITAVENLKKLSSAYDNAQANLSYAEAGVRGQYEQEGETIAWGFMMNPDSMSSDALKRLAGSIGTIDDIRVTDASATVIASTMNDVGYTFGKGDSSVNSLCWKIMDGECDSELLEKETEKGKYILGVRRQDAKGVIIVELNIPYLDEFFESLDIGEVMLTTDMGDATCLAIEQEEPDVIIMARPGADEIDYLDASFSDKVLANGYTGIQRVQGIRYYLNTLHNTEHDVILISALAVKNISHASAVKNFTTIITGMAVFLIILLFGEARIPKAAMVENEAAAEHKKDKRDNAAEDTLNERFKLDIRNMAIVNGVLLVLLLVFDYIIAEKPLLGYLLSSQWNKGLNLFSLTMILLTTAACSMAGFIFNRVILLIFNNMGSRGMTVGNLLSSLTRFVFLIFAIILALRELGCNLSALLTGAGIAGAAISLCASKTINDLLSGFFIVFEGAFRIGDWIQVEDWRGQVVSIGMRTTKIACGDCVKIINNSSLTNVTVMDKTGSGAIARIDVAYKENLQDVIALLNDNREVFMKEIPEIDDGPYVKGVVDLGASGVTIEMYALGEQKYIKKIERDMRLVAKQLMDENGIEIPFTQVTIHSGD